jgi:hypothetical protein
MEQLLLINPKARSKKIMRKRRTRTAAQKRATARLVAANKSRRTRRASPKRSYAPNPIRARRRRAPALVTRHVRRRRRNPIRVPGLGGAGGLFMPALTGAAGALAVDAVMTYVPLPAALTSGNMGAVTRAATAVLLGTVGRKVFGRAATSMAIGALTVAVYQSAKGMLANAGMSLGYYGAGMTTNVLPAVNAAPAVAAGMGAYLPRGNASRGNFNFSPANQFGEYIR